LFNLTQRLTQRPEFKAVLKNLAAGQYASIDGVWGSADALITAATAEKTSFLLVVVEDDLAAERMLAELPLFGKQTVAEFPALDPRTDTSVLLDFAFGERLRLLKQLQAGENHPRILVTTVMALMQPVPTPEELTNQSKLYTTGDELHLDAFAKWLVKNGFHSVTGVELPGEFAVRGGGIIDLFAPDWVDPLRIELFGDEIESIRSFSIETQRSLENRENFLITLLDQSVPRHGHLAQHFPADSWCELIELGHLEVSAKGHLKREQDVTHLHGWSEVMKSLADLPTLCAASVGGGTSSDGTRCQLAIESVERFSGEIVKVLAELDTFATGREVHVVCPTAAEIERLEELFASSDLAQSGKLHFQEGSLSRGFHFPSENVTLLGSGEMFRRTETRRTSSRKLGKTIDSFIELREGDYVIHVSHGLARFRGIKLREAKHGGTEETLVLQFSGSVLLYVPTSRIGLVQKYVGGKGVKPKLAKLNGSMWERRKQKVVEATFDLAAELLEIQAKRQARPGVAFPDGTPWQREFDASFPYTETPDQDIAIHDILKDMATPKPMDRLLCGDVGFGKTEVAMRAAFRAAEAGYQVAVLAPTTVLVEQHYRTLCERFAEFPFTIEKLSRFSKASEQRKIVERINAGNVDIVVGTHRLAGKDVQPPNLGLLIIDEEQRFGVEIKERLKHLRSMVDILTMTATPIPRTLHLGLLGLRDISNLETPPESRIAVETRITRWSDELIRNALLRELDRGGQAFFVHNRVQSIEGIAQRLREIIPEARIAIGHGQMAEGELSKVMLDFLEKRYDVLLATTIIESGLDIPGADTIFIDQADRYGLSDLHQLRGRVGRYRNRAYCYMLVDEHKVLGHTAGKRLHAIEEYSQLGSGFSIAMRDLEIRGAGNILGAQQSGNIAAVGYELYCDLLAQASRQLQKLPPEKKADVHLALPLSTSIPESYVADRRMKVDLYRRIARIVEFEHVDAIRSELVDRFGAIPHEVENLLTLAKIRAAALRWDVHTVAIDGKYLIFRGSSPAKLEQLASYAQAAGHTFRVFDHNAAGHPLGPERNNPDQVIHRVLELLG